MLSFVIWDMNIITNINIVIYSYLLSLNFQKEEVIVYLPQQIASFNLVKWVSLMQVTASFPDNLSCPPKHFICTTVPAVTGVFRSVVSMFLCFQSVSKFLKSEDENIVRASLLKTNKNKHTLTNTTQKANKPFTLGM